MSADPVLIRRTGSAPLKLVGYKRAASASSRAVLRDDESPKKLGPLSKRWHELDLWRSDTPGAIEAVLAIRYVDEWTHAQGREWAFAMPWNKVAEFLAQASADAGYEGRAHAFDPLEFVSGFPALIQFKERQEQLLDALENGWDHAVSDLLEAAGIVEG